MVGRRLAVCTQLVVYYQACFSLACSVGCAVSSHAIPHWNGETSSEAVLLVLCVLACLSRFIGTLACLK